MTKDVLITVNGLRLEGNESDDIELVTSGTYYSKRGKDYILYEEHLQEIDGATKCNVIIDDNKVDIIKHGQANVHIIFKKLKKNSSYYQTPFGSILVGFHTTELEVKKDDDEIKIYIKYNLEVNYNHISENDILIKVQAKN